MSEVDDLRARLHVAQVRARFFQEENVRLRARVHEVVDECQRRFAPDLKELTHRRWLAVWADEELEKYWTGRFSHVSTLGHTIIENLMDRIKKDDGHG
jgi:predicted transcriptional regulator